LLPWVNKSDFNEVFAEVLKWSERPAGMLLQLIRDAIGEIVEISVTVMDIAERKRLEQALAESDDHFRHALE